MKKVPSKLAATDLQVYKGSQGLTVDQPEIFGPVSVLC